MEITAHAKRAEPSCNPCLFMKISQVSNQQESITLLIYQNVLDSAVAISVANVVKVSIPSNKYPIKKRHPKKGCPYIYKKGVWQLTPPTRC